MLTRFGPAPRTDWRIDSGLYQPELRDVAALMLWTCGITATANRLLAPRLCLLLFHRAAWPAEWPNLPNRNFYLDMSFLDHLLLYLRKTGREVVTLDEMVREPPNSKRRLVNISVDDTYRDTYELVVPAFRRHGVPVTLFVQTGIPDGTDVMWTSGLETILQENNEILLNAADGCSPVALMAWNDRARLFRHLVKSWEARGAETAYREFCALNGYDLRKMSERHAMHWDMLADCRDDPHIELGAHSVSHPHLAALSEARAWQEIVGSRKRLVERLGVEIRHFAFPFGQSGDCGPREARLAREAGFATASTTRKGVLRTLEGRDLFALPRNNLNGASRRMASVEISLSGLGGLVSRMALVG
jgi:peptidoglycan/xylan/chitin deacetylase (PgdA/CDA1 family)